MPRLAGSRRLPSTPPSLRSSQGLRVLVLDRVMSGRDGWSFTNAFNRHRSTSACDFLGCRPPIGMTSEVTAGTLPLTPVLRPFHGTWAEDRQTDNLHRPKHHNRRLRHPFACQRTPGRRFRASAARTSTASPTGASRWRSVRGVLDRSWLRPLAARPPPQGALQRGPRGPAGAGMGRSSRIGGCADSRCRRVCHGTRHRGRKSALMLQIVYVARLSTISRGTPLSATCTAGVRVAGPVYGRRPPT